MTRTLQPLGPLAPRSLVHVAVAAALSSLLITATSCGEQKKAPPAPKARSLAVEGTAEPTPAATPAAAVSAPRPKRVLCDGQIERAGREFPEPKLARKAAPGAPAVGTELPIGGQWTWVNFWAAWCQPCKEEIPLLRDWEKRLNAAGESFQLAFVSMDDDTRQLEGFLASQPDGGLRATFWLDNPEERSKWLAKTGLGSDPELPAHLLVDPKGKIRCAFQGAVEATDYERIRAIIAK
jgi:thiol-disulfide isomerase/thioredoxin